MNMGVLRKYSICNIYFILNLKNIVYKDIFYVNIEKDTV